MLVKLLAVGGGKDYLVIFSLGLEGADAAVYGLYLHHHAGKTAVGIVVHAAPFVLGVVAQIVQMYLSQPLLLGTCQDRFVNKALEHFGQNGNDIYSHIVYFSEFHLQSYDNFANHLLYLCSFSYLCTIFGLFL